MSTYEYLVQVAGTNYIYFKDNLLLFKIVYQVSETE
jgi:hypothetical protein